MLNNYTMKKPTLILALLFMSLCISAQKYVLIDETMMVPLQFKDCISLKDTYKHIFIVEKTILREFVTHLRRISGQITRNNYHCVNFSVGNTLIRSRIFIIGNESRFDIMLTTCCKDVTVNMHLSDLKYSNVQNSDFINCLAKYINSYLPS